MRASSICCADLVGVENNGDGTCTIATFTTHKKSDKSASKKYLAVLFGLPNISNATFRAEQCVCTLINGLLTVSGMATVRDELPGDLIIAMNTMFKDQNVVVSKEVKRDFLTYDFDFIVNVGQYGAILNEDMVCFDLYVCFVHRVNPCLGATTVTVHSEWDLGFRSVSR